MQLDKLVRQNSDNHIAIGILSKLIENKPLLVGFEDEFKKEYES